MELHPYGPVEKIMAEQEIPLASNQGSPKQLICIAVVLVLIGSAAILYRQWQLRNEEDRI